MGIPLSFLLGLALVLVFDVVHPALPGARTTQALLPCLPLVLVPWLLTRFLARRIRHQILVRRSPMGSLRALVWVQNLAVPAVYFALLDVGGLHEFAREVGPESHLAQLTILLVPLLAMETWMRYAERRAARWLEVAGLATPLLGTGRLPLIAFVCVPVVLFAGALDLVYLHRGLELFFHATALGMVVGFALMLAVLALLLPLAFRVVLPTTRILPAHLRAPIHEAARALGFAPGAVLQMRTGHRLVNAALVGPLRWPRYLVLTDGLLALLDPRALRGVVAHEVGHARAGHPLLLLLVFVVLPVLLVHPVLLLGVTDAAGRTQWLGLGGAVAAGILTLRVLAHRFEYEADTLSAQALGGAGAVIDALRRVGDLWPTSAQRNSLRHPSEERRIAHLLRCESEPGYLQAFEQRGRRLRGVLAALGIVALVCCAYAQVRLRPLDRAYELVFQGRFPEATAALTALPGDLPAAQQEDAVSLRGLLAAAREIVPEGGDWRAIRERLAAESERRGAEVLAAEGPAAALPWYALHVSAAVRATPLAHSWYLYCRAAADHDAEQVDLLRAHLQALGVIFPG
ncbi:MAG: M48 family metalloprotease [Planctomycetes bacterium]|nr:M48 family metalloprotease [Planctomycetota bacterium]